MNDRQELRAAYAGLRDDPAARRARDAAELLGVSEAELVASGALGPVRALSDGFAAIIGDLPSLGRVMALTRNEDAVHEKVGTYENLDLHPAHGIALGSEIDLRIFFARWHVAFALENEAGGRTLRSLQFFDGQGAAVHKVFLREDAQIPAYEALVARHAGEDRWPLALRPSAAAKPDPADAAIDVASLREGWRSLRDTHDFRDLLIRHKAGRLQALRLAGEEFVREVAADSPRLALEAAAAGRVPIMVFVGNPGMIQIHSGPVHRIEMRGPWLNVLDEGFNLHMRADRVASAWVVRKPTEDGDVTSLELYDGSGGLIAQMFGSRKPGQPEREEWRTVLRTLPMSAMAAE